MIIAASFLSGGLFEVRLEMADEYFEQKNYEIAVNYYDYVIRTEEDTEKVASAEAGKKKSQDFIDEAKSETEHTFPRWGKECVFLK